MERRQATEGRIRKRKADSFDSNERLSKRLSLLNLERNGQKLYIPVEQCSKAVSPKRRHATCPDSDAMQLDNTKHKVYIYNLDDELSDSDSSVDENKLVFLTDIDKHLRNTRIPPSILANSEGELAGANISNELVLYNIPSSLTVSEDNDSVRKAIIETRARAQEKQRREREIARTASTVLTSGYTPPPVSTGILLPTNGIPQPLVHETIQQEPDAMDLS